MGLSNAWNVAANSLATNAGLTSIVSRNISNAQIPLKNSAVQRLRSDLETFSRLEG
jgi:hypothetical protein